MAQAQVEALIATGTSCRGWVTRQRTAIRGLVDGVKDHPSRDVVGSLRERLAKLKSSACKGIEAYSAALELVELEDRQAIEDRIAEVEAAVDDAELTVLAAISDVERALAPAALPPGPPGAAAAVAPQPARPPAPRMMDSLKPERLCLTASPIDVTSWKKEFGTYFRRSGVDAWSDLEDQHNVLMACVTKELATRIRSDPLYRPNRSVLRADPATNDSLLEIIDGIFLAEIPIFNRRLEFWSMKQTEGETVDQFVDLLEHRAREADIASMSRG
jgi:hypothetical protein